MTEIINFILHVDQYLLELTQNYGVWIYAILFVIVLAETGLVVTPSFSNRSSMASERSRTSAPFRPSLCRRSVERADVRFIRHRMEAPFSTRRVRPSNWATPSEADPGYTSTRLLGSRRRY